MSESEILLPFSATWGFDRGGSIDRYYIDDFVKLALRGRQGRFLEFGSPTYKKFVEPGNIDLYDIIDIDPNNPRATIVGDIEQLWSIEDDTFDVIICTQVLQLVKHPELAVKRMHRLMKPSGLLVISVPFISKASDVINDRWRFSNIAVEQLLSAFTEKDITIAGNLFSSICFLLGLGMHDVNDHDLDPVDPRHYTVVLATAIK